MFLHINQQFIQYQKILKKSLTFWLTVNYHRLYPPDGPRDRKGINMANYTVGDVRRDIEGLDDSQAVFGFIMPSALIEEGDDGRMANPGEWEAIVEEAERLVTNGSHNIWDLMWEVLREATDNLYGIAEV